MLDKMHEGIDEAAREDRAWRNVTFRYGKTHTIEKRRGKSVNLGSLKDNQSVCAGDGETFYFLLTRKD